MRSNEMRWVVTVLATGMLAGCPAQSETMGGTSPYTTAGPVSSNGDVEDDDGSGDTDGEDEESGDPSASGQDSDPDGDEGPQTTGDPGDDSSVTTGPSGETGSEGGAVSEGGVDPSLQSCLDMAADSCEECACNNCLPELMACQSDPGCVAIRMCAQENMCTGIGCLEPCGDVIDANGGAFGPSAGLASDLSDCYEGACGAC